VAFQLSNGGVAGLDVREASKRNPCRQFSEMADVDGRQPQLPLFPRPDAGYRQQFGHSKVNMLATSANSPLRKVSYFQFEIDGDVARDRPTP
jgi:hypothetical protein